MYRPSSMTTMASMFLFLFLPLNATCFGATDVPKISRAIGSVNDSRDGSYSARADVFFDNGIVFRNVRKFSANGEVVSETSDIGYISVSKKNEITIEWSRAQGQVLRITGTETATLSRLKNGKLKHQIKSKTGKISVPDTESLGPIDMNSFFDKKTRDFLPTIAAKFESYKLREIRQRENHERHLKVWQDELENYKRALDVLVPKWRD